MPKAIETLKNLKAGHFGLGVHGGGPASVKQAVHDGDTIIVRALGNLSVRFLGIDTPEISFMPPGKQSFVGIGHADWEAFLSNPFDPRWQLPDFPQPLRDYLEARVGPGCAANHHRHAMIAQRGLEAEVEADQNRLGHDNESFRFFLAFAHEVMDRYGRLLGYINVETDESPRPADYNARLLERALALPYFIWPNVNPFRRQPSLPDAVPAPGRAAAVADEEKTLRQAREMIRTARAEKRGLFDANDPLRLEAFELRYLAGRRLPGRWLVDLSGSADELVPPHRYFEIPHPEDRLWIPEAYVPLFVEKGWRRGA